VQASTIQRPPTAECGDAKPRLFGVLGGALAGWQRNRGGLVRQVGKNCWAKSEGVGCRKIESA